MRRRRADGAGAPEGVQRRVRRSRLLFTAPLTALVLLCAVLLWEVLRANVSDGARSGFPWRVELLGPEALGSLLAVAAGAVLARAQYARTVRPYLGLRGAWTDGALTGGGSAWRVGVLNGGHVAVVESWDYCLVPAGRPRRECGWTGAAELGVALASAGLVVGEDFQVVSFGAGFPLVRSDGYETVLIGTFSRRFTREVDALLVRVRVADVVGDAHERVMDCLAGVRHGTSVPRD
ncbi:hypothetical protein [uncultured Streptomyces sp.]|uniref:hypothetical protein n=1 Tax=uncultured Streptomyces sp. TaxID=174707 RepID=UPI002636B004|nr:hypothetical protein [uncultured Streptomyces sp.]